MFKTLAVVGSSLISMCLMAILPPEGPEGPPPPPDRKKHDAKKPDPKKEKAKEKEKGEPGPAGDLKKAYDAIRRIRLDEGRGGRPEERLRDWVRRATDLYRDGLRELKDDNPRLAHEYGTMAHDLARATEHAGNAARLGRKDDDLPPPPGDSPEEERERTRRDLRRAYDRIREIEDQSPPPEASFYVDAARDLYRAARQDAQDGRDDRAGELARAAEAMTHVTEHLGHSLRGSDAPPPPRIARIGSASGPDLPSLAATCPRPLTDQARTN